MSKFEEAIKVETDIHCLELRIHAEIDPEDASVEVWGVSFKTEGDDTLRPIIRLKANHAYQPIARSLEEVLIREKCELLEELSAREVQYQKEQSEIARSER